MSNIYFSFQCLVIIHMQAQFKDNCVGTCAYVGCMCNVDIFIIFRKPLKRVWCTCSVCGLLHFSYMYVCYEWREWTGYQSTVCGVTIKSRATNPHQVVFPCLEIGKVVKKKPVTAQIRRCWSHWWSSVILWNHLKLWRSIFVVYHIFTSLWGCNVMNSIL